MIKKIELTESLLVDIKVQNKRNGVASLNQESHLGSVVGEKEVRKIEDGIEWSRQTGMGLHVACVYCHPLFFFLLNFLFCVGV